MALGTDINLTLNKKQKPKARALEIFFFVSRQHSKLLINMFGNNFRE